MAQTFIYAIYNINKNEVKIGYSIDPIKRLAQLQCGTTDKLNLLVTFLGDINIESALHKKLEAYSVSGEWFQNNKAVLIELEKALTSSLIAIASDEDVEIKYVEHRLLETILNTRKSQVTIPEIYKGTEGISKKQITNALDKLGWTKKTYASGNVVYLKPKK